MDDKISRYNIEMEHTDGILPHGEETESDLLIRSEGYR